MAFTQEFADQIILNLDKNLNNSFQILSYITSNNNPKEIEQLFLNEKFLKEPYKNGFMYFLTYTTIFNTNFQNNKKVPELLISYGQDVLKINFYNDFYKIVKNHPNFLTYFKNLKENISDNANIETFKSMLAKAKTYEHLSLIIKTLKNNLENKEYIEEIKKELHSKKRIFYDFDSSGKINQLFDLCDLNIEDLKSFFNKKIGHFYSTECRNPKFNSYFECLDFFKSINSRLLSKYIEQDKKYILELLEVSIFTNKKSYEREPANNMFSLLISQKDDPKTLDLLISLLCEVIKKEKMSLNIPNNTNTTIWILDFFKNNDPYFKNNLYKENYEKLQHHLVKIEKKGLDKAVKNTLKTENIKISKAPTFKI